jgi:hypothetical protein
MNIEFELFPINPNKSDYRFHLNLQPIEIIYDSVSDSNLIKENLISNNEKNERSLLI